MLHISRHISCRANFTKSCRMRRVTKCPASCFQSVVGQVTCDEVVVPRSGHATSHLPRCSATWASCIVIRAPVSLWEILKLSIAHGKSHILKIPVDKSDIKSKDPPPVRYANRDATDGRAMEPPTQRNYLLLTHPVRGLGCMRIPYHMHLASACANTGSTCITRQGLVSIFLFLQILFR